MDVISDSRTEASRPVFDLSIVVPLFNEAYNLLPLYEALNAVLIRMNKTWEILFINDGSTDGSYDLLCRLAERDRKVKVINLRRNFGQTAAMAAGFDYAHGRIIIPMDGDMQNDPVDIPL